MWYPYKCSEMDINTQMEAFCFLVCRCMELKASCWAADSASNAWSRSGMAHEYGVTNLRFSLTRSFTLGLVEAAVTL